jgi:hypothetical protein
MSAQDALQAVLGAEHAAIFGYGTLGPHLRPSARETAAEAERAHRERRDAVALLLVELKAQPAPAARAYTAPFPVTTAASALKLAVLLEERTAATWRAAVPDLADDRRRTALEALIDCAVRAARWRRALAPQATPTVPFPGV